MGRSGLVVDGRCDRRQLGSPAALASRIEHLAGEAIALVQVKIRGAEIHRIAQESGIWAQVDDLYRAAHLPDGPAGAVLGGDLKGVVDDGVHRPERAWEPARTARVQHVDAP